MNIRSIFITAAVSTIGLTLALIVSHANPQGEPVAATIRAHSIEIVDSNNRTRCVIGTSSEGTTVINILGKDGRTAVSLSSDASGDGELDISGKGRSSASIIIGHDGNPSIMMAGTNGKKTITP